MKTYVVDTNVLIQAPYAVQCFEEHLVVLPVVAIVVLRQRSFREVPGDIDRRRQRTIVLSASLVIGAYDGFYGPGTGTFLPGP